MSTADSTTLSLAADTTLAELALRSDAHAAVLARHRLDFCCGGRRTLAQACEAAGLDENAVLAEIEAEVRARAAVMGAAPDWNERSLADVVDFIVETHHRFARAAIARIMPLLAKVGPKHRGQHPELAKIALAFAELAIDLEPHMVREERVLFPYIRALAAASGPPPSPAFGTAWIPIQRMMAEHDRAGELVDEIFEATRGFSPPADACTSYRALYGALAELRLDLLKHVALENNVVFPRAVDLERRRRALAS